MTERFAGGSGPGIVTVELRAPAGRVRLPMALDTGATGTLVSLIYLEALGCDPALAKDRVQVTSGSGMECAVKSRVARFTALARTLEDFPILGYNLPPTGSVEGLLGLDFFRGCRVEIDFREGCIELHV